MGQFLFEHRESVVPRNFFPCLYTHSSLVGSPYLRVAVWGEDLIGFDLFFKGMLRWTPTMMCIRKFHAKRQFVSFSLGPRDSTVIVPASIRITPGVPVLAHLPFSYIALRYSCLTKKLSFENNFDWLVLRINPHAHGTTTALQSCDHCEGIYSKKSLLFPFSDILSLSPV